jgi:uncharacterized membrane protein YhaH (DUF805 family)
VEDHPKDKKMSWYLRALKKYAVFHGRAHQKEYWMFVLVHTIIYLGLAFIDGLSFGFGLLPIIYSLGVLLPILAAGVRRLHDTDRSGWWLIVPLVNFIFVVQEGTGGDNRFGPDPKKVAVDLTKADLIPDSPIYRDGPLFADVTVPETSPEQVDELEPQGWISCEDCGDKVSKRLTVCPHCGCPMEPKVICPDCGENFVASRAACPACGGPAPDSSG